MSVRILFVDPYGWQGAANGNPAFPNVGIAYLVPPMRRAGWEVSVLDLNNEALERTEILYRVADFAPDVIGFSCKTATYEYAAELACFLKRNWKPDFFAVFGGPHITLNADSLAGNAQCPADFLFVGEGERDLPEICTAWVEHRAFAPQYGLVASDAGMIPVYRPNRAMPLDDLEFPEYDLFPENVRQELAEHYPMITSRGCPYHCIYCTVPLVSGSQWRKRSAERVIQEVSEMRKRYGICSFRIFDDSWNVDIKRSKEICRKLLEQDYIIRWECPNGMRADRIDEELAGLMARTGCFFAAVGIESANPVVLANLRKNITLEEIRHGIRLLQQKGILVSGFFIIGLPLDNAAGVALSLQFVQKEKIQALFGLLIPYPHTQVYEFYREHGRFLMPPEEGLHFSNTWNKINVVCDTPEFPASARRRMYVQAYLQMHKSGMLVGNIQSPWLQYLAILYLYGRYDLKRLLPFVASTIKRRLFRLCGRNI